MKSPFSSPSTPGQQPPEQMQEGVFGRVKDPEARRRIYATLQQRLIERRQRSLQLQQQARQEF